MNEGYKRPPVKRHTDPYGRGNKPEPEEDEGFSGVIEGPNAVTEALRTGRPIDKVYISRGERSSQINYIAGRAREQGAVVAEVPKSKLDNMSVTHAHQGIIAIAAVKEYSAVSDILRIAEERGEAPFIIICDEISDPHNLGAIIRSAECAGAHGIIIPKRRNAGITAVVEKTSAGAVEYMAVARVANISAAMKDLKKAGVWIYGTEAGGGSELWDTDFRGPLAVVIGSEGSGMSRLVSENCDFKVNIPMCGKISSLNASASAAVVMYEVLRQRRRG